MRRTFTIFLLCFTLLFSSCAQTTPPADIDTETATVSTIETDAETTEEIRYALVDWMIFVRYNGRSYTRDFSEPSIVSEADIGDQLGTVTRKPPSPTPVDYTANVPDLTSFGYPIGTPFYEIAGVPIEYEIAVYDSETKQYHRLCYGDLLPHDTQIVREMFLMEYNYPAVRLFENATEFSSAYRESFPDFDEAFFEDNVLAMLYLEEGSGSVSHVVTMVRRVGDTIEIHVRREIPETGTCDMAYWAIAVSVSRKDWDGAAIVPCVSGYDTFPTTAKNNAQPFYLDHPAYTYVRYQQQLYLPADEHTNASIADHALGKQLGMVEHEIPATITAGYSAPDFSARNFDVGMPIYEVAGRNPDYFIAVPQYEGGPNILLFRYDTKLSFTAETLYNVRTTMAEEANGTILTVESRASLDALFDLDELPDAFSALDDAFFKEHLLVLIPYTSVRASTQMGISAVYRMGEDVMICAQSDIAIPTQGEIEADRDVLLYAILEKSAVTGQNLRLWHAIFAE